MADAPIGKTYCFRVSSTAVSATPNLKSMSSLKVKRAQFRSNRVRLRCLAADVHLHHPPAQRRQDRLCCTGNGSSPPTFSIPSPPRGSYPISVEGGFSFIEAGADRKFREKKDSIICGQQWVLAVVRTRR